MRNEVTEALHAAKEDARKLLDAAYVAGDQPAIDAAMAVLRQFTAARGHVDHRKRKPAPVACHAFTACIQPHICDKSGHCIWGAPK